MLITVDLLFASGCSGQNLRWPKEVDLPSYVEALKTNPESTMTGMALVDLPSLCLLACSDMHVLKFHCCPYTRKLVIISSKPCEACQEPGPSA